MRYDTAEELYFVHLGLGTATARKAPRKFCRKRSDHVDDPAEEEAYFAHLKTV